MAARPDADSRFTGLHRGVRLPPGTETDEDTNDGVHVNRGTLGVLRGRPTDGRRPQAVLSAAPP
jgi:hypothetical protein